MDLRQPEFTYSACRPFTKNKEIIQKFKETWDSRYIYKNELGKARFQHDMAYGDFEHMPKRTGSYKVSYAKAIDIAKNPKYYGYQRGFASMVYNFFDKKPNSGGAVTRANNSIIKSKNALNQELTEELHKTTIEKFEKHKVYSSFKDNIWGADPVYMQLISKFNKGICFLLTVIDILSKYTLVFTLKEKKLLKLVMLFKLF